MPVYQRWFWHVSSADRDDSTLKPTVSPDGTTALPTFMPVATQAALKGLSQQQTEELGISIHPYLFVEILLSRN